MGDRGNIFVQEAVEDGKRVGVYLYGHWSGFQMPAILQRALKHEERWDDPQYFSRIVFQELVGDDRGCTGYGISARKGDNEYAILIANCEKQVVEQTKRGHDADVDAKVVRTWTFKEFSALKLDEKEPWDSLR
jgi:hypothetical protein